MRKTFLKALGFFACLAWSSMACAVGFGGINVTSSLGQPLVAEIELVAVEKTDKSNLTARLASPEAFKGAGIDYPYALPKLKFHVETRANGEAYIKATSEQPVNEPFVSLLIELGWSSGRLLREYTFLLDPPGFVAEQPAAQAVKPIEPVVVAPVVTPVPAPAPQVEPAPQMIAEPQAASAAAPATAVAEAAPATVADAAKPAEPVATADVPPVKEEVKEVAPVPTVPKAESSHAVVGPITVKRGDTLSKIAHQTKSADVSLERMLVALYRANTEAFEGKNMNRLRTGKILRLPETEELAKLQQPEAAAEVRVQVADWNSYRQKLAAANAPATDQRAKQEVAGKISTSIAEKTPDAKEPAKEVLKLSKGEAPGDTAAAGGKAKSAKEKAIAKEEDSIAKTKALKEAEQRTAMLEKSVKDMQRLVELKNQAAAAKAGQDKLGAASAPASVVPLGASAVAATSEVAAAKPKPKAIAPKVVTPAPSLIDDILGNPVYLGGGAAVLLGLGGLAFMRTRRTKTDNEKVVSSGEEVGSAAGRIAAPVMPSPETGDFTNAAVSTAMAVNVDEVDPIGEADMFLNFGRDVQAEEVLKDALHKDPSNIPVKLKLLSIYATRKDTKSFYIYALEIKQSGDEAAWGQVAAMGRALEPNNALYGGSGDEMPAVAASAADAALPAVDFDLGFGGKEQEQSAATFDVPTEMAPDVSVGEKTLIMSASELRAAQEVPMDFDVTGTHPGIKSAPLEESKLDLAAMDFDVSAIGGVKISAPEESKLNIPAMDFDVTVQPSAPAQAAEISAEETPALNLDDLVFDVTSTHQAKDAPAAPAVEADQGMAFTIDFPTEAKPEATAQSAAPVKDVGLSEISLSLNGVEAPAAPTASAPKGEQWQEVATKLDLAKAYQEMGDQDGAREILGEVMRDGDESQRETAQALLAQLV
ncbi:MAG: pilus assembly protein [Gallionellaceae bacterium]|nr:MAG: pilus assembly protein [Gallionellaceae bacterium]